MKKLFIIAAMLFASVGYCQQTKDTGIDPDKLKRQIDSSNKMMETLGNSMYKKMQDDDIKKDERKQYTLLFSITGRAKTKRKRSRIPESYFRIFFFGYFSSWRF